MNSRHSAIRVLSWNVRGCLGRAGRFVPDGVIGVVRRLAPDIVSLQEIDGRRALTGGLDTFAYLREALDWRGAEARTIRTPEGDYGHILMSRWPVEDVVKVDLSIARREPRAAIACAVDSPGGRIRVIAAHLGLRARERRKQLHRLVDEVKRYAGEPTVILGDFNEWRARGRLLSRILRPAFQVAAAIPTYPTRWPIFALDQIWCRAPLVPLAARVASEARHLSDHLPVLAELAYGGDE